MARVPKSSEINLLAVLGRVDQITSPRSADNAITLPF